MSAGLPRVLVVEDDDAIRTLLVAALRREPFDVDNARDGAAALEMTAGVEYAVIVLDLMMPRLNGFEFLDAFHTRTPDARSIVFVVTAFDVAAASLRSTARVEKLRKTRERASASGVNTDRLSTCSTSCAGHPL